MVWNLLNPNPLMTSDENWFHHLSDLLRRIFGGSKPTFKIGDGMQMKRATRKSTHVFTSRKASLTWAELNSERSRVPRSRARRSVAILRSSGVRNHATVVSVGMMETKRIPMRSVVPPQTRYITRQLAMAIEWAPPTRYMRTASQIVARPPALVHHLKISLTVPPSDEEFGKSPENI